MNNRVAIERLETPQAVALRAAQICAERSRAVSERFVVALSGGSTPRLFHAAWVKEPNVPWSKIRVLFSDERAVPADHTDSNYRMAKETLLDVAPIPETQVFRVEAEDGDAVRAARAYEERLRSLRLVPPDLLILGMGDDGHSASLFPAAKLQSGWVIAAEAPPESPIRARVTFNYELIAATRDVLLLVTGASKADRLHQVLSGPGDLPIQRILAARSHPITLLVDRAAASRIEV